MKKYITILTCLILVSLSNIQAQTLSLLSTEFTSPNDLTSWRWLHEKEKWPDKVINKKITDGILYIEPGTSGWFADKNAPFLYREISGDFDVRTRVKTSGLTTDVPQTLWSLGGLMVRVPKRDDKTKWKPHQENWLFITTGIAQTSGKHVIETKYTLNSKSNLKLRDCKNEWINLRIVRNGHAFILLYKYDNDKQWTVQERYYIADWPPVLEVGLNAYTNSMAVPGNILWGDAFRFNNESFDHLGKCDFRLAVDYVRFKEIPVGLKSQVQPNEYWLYQVSQNKLTDYSLSNSELLRLLGD